jgi:hypothetical protein
MIFIVLFPLILIFTVLNIVRNAIIKTQNPGLGRRNRNVVPADKIVEDPDLIVINNSTL